MSNKYFCLCCCFDCLFVCLDCCDLALLFLLFLSALTTASFWGLKKKNYVFHST